MRYRVFIVALCLVVLSISIPQAQQSLFSGCSSASIVYQPVLFNCDFYDPIGIPGVEVALHYRWQADDYFTELTMQLMDEMPYYMFTYETEVSFPYSPGILEYYFSACMDSFKATQSPENSSDQFPPASYKYAPFADEPQGDTLPGTIGGWLDLTGSGMTYSDSKIYGYLSNATGDWPTNQGFDTYFIYCLGFIDTTLTDVWFFTMIYAQVPFILEPGLYKVNLMDTLFYQIGDIVYDISDGKLHMSCDIVDLVNDPDWQGWPEQASFVISEGVTLTILSYNVSINDFTFPTFFEPETQFLDFGDNAPPEIFDYWVAGSEDVGMEAVINYCDPDNNLPIVRRFYFDWGVYDMGSYDHIYSDTSEFEYISGWPGEGWHYFHFEFSDGSDTVHTPTDSIYLMPTGVDGDITLASEFILHQNYPNPFNAFTSINFEILHTGRINLSVYDLAGRCVVLLLDEYLEPGPYSVVWDGKDNAERLLSSGVYFYRLKTAGHNITRKMVYLK